MDTPGSLRWCPRPAVFASLAGDPGVRHRPSRIRCALTTLDIRPANESAMSRSAGCRATGREPNCADDFGTYSAQPPANRRTQPDNTELDKDRPLTMLVLVRGRSCWCGRSRIQTLEGLSRDSTRDHFASTSPVWSYVSGRTSPRMSSPRMLLLNLALWESSARLWRRAGPPTGTTALRAALRAVLGRSPTGRSTHAPHQASGDLSIRQI
jgi:hypothetical protein